nr:immunoglobulin light chain junction region [Macaca mulatta]
CQHVYGTPFTF